MCIYCGTKNYRKIYENHHGPIPIDESGRSYEIHHLDGNHANNSPENLVCVSIQEHYQIHESQGDWAACLAMSDRMNLSPEETSKLSSKTQRDRLERGVHHFQGEDHPMKKAARDGTHHWTSEFAQERSRKAVENGTLNLLKRPDGSSLSGDLVKAGTHHFVKNNPVNKTLKDGRHASQIRVSCSVCHKETSKNLFKQQHNECFPRNFPPLAGTSK